MRRGPTFDNSTKSVMQIDTYTGGVFDTNCFCVTIETAVILFDAPQGAADWLASRGLKPTLLLLTHGHIDHVLDAARIKREYGCRVGYHRDGTQMLTEPGFFRSFGFGFEVEPVSADLDLAATPSMELGGIDFEILEVPGHCPGSLCFHWKDTKTLFGGDVLFAGAVGRWDLPGGDRDLLLRGICEKLVPLGEDVKVLPGHGPATTIGQELRTNPFLQ